MGLSLDLDTPCVVANETRRLNESSNDGPGYGQHCHSGSTAITEQLLSLYYSTFHKAHPCVLPHHALKQKMNGDPGSTKVVVSAVLFIGALYAPSITSAPFEEELQRELNKYHCQPSPFYVQSLLLYSIALYWSNEIERASEYRNEAIKIAVAKGMYLQEFPLRHGNGDPVLEESWRRTWWEIYLTDAAVSASSHALNFKTSGLAMTVELPCEDEMYELMVRLPRNRDSAV